MSGTRVEVEARARLIVHRLPDDRGFSLMSSYDHISEIPGRINASLMHVEVVKACHRHQLQSDHWVVLRGSLTIGPLNTEGSPIAARLGLAGASPEQGSASDVT